MPTTKKTKSTTPPKSMFTTTQVAIIRDIIAAEVNRAMLARPAPVQANATPAASVPKAAPATTKREARASRVKPTNVVPLPKQLDAVTLNHKEALVLVTVGNAGRGGGVTNDDLARMFARRNGITLHKGGSWARNSVRKPIRERLMRRIHDGAYALTERGFKAYGRADMTKMRTGLRAADRTRFAAKKAA